MVIGYTTGVYDLFHIGHLNLLRNARGLCDRLIVGVTSDELVAYKGKKSVIPFEERIQIVGSCQFVDAVVVQENMDKVEQIKKLKANVLFVGDDWYDTVKWKQYELELDEVGVKVIYFPYTKGTSSSLINQVLNDLRS